MRTASIVGTAAVLLGLSSLTALTAGEPALAVMAAKAKSFLCSSSAACVTAVNSGAGIGVSGGSSASNGVQGVTSSAAASGVYGEADNAAGGAGVAGRTVNGTDDNSEALLGDGGNHGGLGLMVLSGAGTVADMIVARNLNTRTNTLVLDNQGNMRISGLLSQGGSAPTLEWTGEARLARGEAIVGLDESFAKRLDERQGYIVLLTPEGDVPGLFVARRTPSGFVVREAGGGRSEAAFAYRIVAHPLMAANQRHR